MAIKNLDGTYACGYCGSKYPDPTKADTCKDSHNLVYVPMTRQDLNGLIHLIIMSDSNVVSSKLFSDLQRYARKAATDGNR